MPTDVLIGLIVLLSVMAVVLSLYAFPKTRPYVKKWWPVAVIIGGTILCVLLFRRRPKTSSSEPEGTQPLDQAITKAQETLNDTILETTIKTTVEETHVQDVQNEIKDINQLPDPYARVAAKAALLKRLKAGGK